MSRSELEGAIVRQTTAVWLLNDAVPRDIADAAMALVPDAIRNVQNCHSQEDHQDMQGLRV